MITRLATITLLSSLLTAPPAFADGGTIQLEGQIVNPTCNVTAATSADTLQTANENDACAGGYPAFTAQYQPLNPGETSVDNQVITLTYN
jgi:type 1 fimbria pilin